MPYHPIPLVSVGSLLRAWTAMQRQLVLLFASSGDQDPQMYNATLGALSSGSLVSIPFGNPANGLGLADAETNCYGVLTEDVPAGQTTRPALNKEVTVRMKAGLAGIANGDGLYTSDTPGLGSNTGGIPGALEVGVITDVANYAGSQTVKAVVNLPRAAAAVG